MEQSPALADPRLPFALDGRAEQMLPHCTMGEQGVCRACGPAAPNDQLLRRRCVVFVSC